MEYALYHGDDFIGIGTVKYLAELINVKPATVNFYKSKTYQKRVPNGYKFVKLEDKND